MRECQQASVLVVDDEKPILEALEDLLEDDFQVFSASNGMDALEILNRHEIAVVLSDQRMPQMKGEEFLARVAERCIATRVLLTGYTDFEDLVSAVNRGHIYAFVPKPWSSHHLRALVRNGVERYQLQTTLRREKVLLEALMEHTPDLIAIKDLDGRYLRLNQAYALALGVDDGEAMVGKTDDELGRTLFDSRPGASPGAAAMEPQLDVTEKALDSSRWYSTTRVVTPQSSAGTSFRVEISRDITARLETTRRLEEQSRRLLSINEELSRVSYIVAHHLQEPLRAVGSFVSLLERRGLFKPGAQEYVEYIYAGVTRAKSVMRDFSTYLELFAPAEKANFALAKCVARALGALPEVLQPWVTIRGEAELEGNPVLLERLVSCLLENCVSHGPEEVRVEITIAQQDGSVLLQVDDNGPGIALEDRKTVMNLFETKSARLGSGLGLALVQRIVSQHEGAVWLDSSPAGGLRVCVKLPVEASARGESEPTSVERVAPLGPTVSSIVPVGPAPLQGKVGDEQIAAQLARLRTFAGTAAHDLHEPLRLVSGYLKLLRRREGVQLGPEGHEFLEAAQGATERMRALIDGLLAYSVSGRLDPGRKRPLADVLAEVRADLKLAIADGGASFLLSPCLDTVMIGEVEGRQLLSNLIGNALKYRSDQSLRIKLTAEHRSGEVAVILEDNGVGVPEHLRETIFEPFVRGDHEKLQRGTGLGLATCARIVSGWGGRIWCESVAQGGSRFVFTVPQEGPNGD